jgi:pimeloyl-ACP methyl ester carboxylesterase
VAVDQRGHGLSAKPDSGYGFDQVTADLRHLIDALALPERPILAGQSWGGNVVLDFAARNPAVAQGLVLVDGGFLELSARPGATWERVSQELRPPDLAGMRREELAGRIRGGNPEWSDEGIEATLGNFETLPDGTVRPWLTLERHMEILRALWDHHPPQLYPRVQEPVLILPADTGDAEWTNRKRAAVEKAEAGLATCRVHWFAATSHDIHVHRPRQLALTMLQALHDGFFQPPGPRG